MATKAELIEMAVGAGLNKKAASAMTKAQIESYLAGGSAPAKAEKGSKPIIRQNPHAWWCPWCDNSNHFNVGVCGKCGAAKEGDEAVR